MKKIKLTTYKYLLPSTRARRKFVFVDDEDFPLISRYRWSRAAGCSTSYARAMINKKGVMMHRLIMNPPEGMVVDHINGKGLDNRRSNLRVVSHSDNQKNVRSPFRLVKSCVTNMKTT